MHKLHYDYIKNKHGNKSRLLFTHTDSQIYEIKEDVYKCFSKDKEILNSNNYFAKMKDETGGVAIKRFVELKPKRCIHS